MSESQLLMWRNKPPYEFTFQAPQAGAYQCEIKFVTGYFDHGDDPQREEFSDVYLNGQLLGTTEDPWCPDVPPGYVVCGNGECETTETHENCPADCECDTSSDCPSGYYCDEDSHKCLFISNPEPPILVNPPSTCKVNQDCKINVKTVDPNFPLRELWIYFDWEGNSQYTLEVIVYAGWPPKEAKHKYQNPGTYTINVYAEDAGGLISPTIHHTLTVNP